ncbi:MAG TPA: hypothetical protein VK545_09755 [Streptomyces sp.]|nr:hypothetical protein [Streptomyces sp.]
MKREIYKGRSIKVVKGRGADFGYTRLTLNGVDQGKWMGDEDAVLRSIRGSIDHADEVGVSSGRYAPEMYAPGTYELCDEGHAKEIGGECGHRYCTELRVEATPVVEEPAEELPGEIVPATDLKPGDVVSRSTFDVSQRAVILNQVEGYEHWLTGPGFRYWARDTATDREGWMTYGPAGVVRRIEQAS